MIENKTAIMTNNVRTYLMELPIDLIYRILDNMDKFTLLCSVRDVNTRLNTIIDTYTRYWVKFIGFFFSRQSS